MKLIMGEKTIESHAAGDDRQMVYDPFTERKVLCQLYIHMLEERMRKAPYDWEKAGIASSYLWLAARDGKYHYSMIGEAVASVESSEEFMKDKDTMRIIAEVKEKFGL